MFWSGSGNGNTIHKNFSRWAEQGVWARAVEKVQPTRLLIGALDQIRHRRKNQGRPIGFGDEQRLRCRGRTLVERCVSKSGCTASVS
ncbi:hypothetical protein [Sciscionella marina]|uniref:hypothetical protein n=1 Tax=Sciscionella marina TaxID=508770 RepID=UPI00037A5DF1|nr:hypothetical protein [Sciscionella marina]